MLNDCCFKIAPVLKAENYTTTGIIPKLTTVVHKGQIDPEFGLSSGYRRTKTKTIDKQATESE